jgi:hypothetical protein
VVDGDVHVGHQEHAPSDARARPMQ